MQESLRSVMYEETAPRSWAKLEIIYMSKSLMNKLILKNKKKICFNRFKLKKRFNKFQNCHAVVKP